MDKHIKKIVELFPAFKSVRETLGLIKKNGWIAVLEKCTSVKSRHDKLIELLPGFAFWPSMPAKELVYTLQREHDLDFGVCDFYSIKDGKQYCNEGGKEYECTCGIPAPFCVIRDKNGKPKYPEFYPSFSSE